MRRNGNKGWNRNIEQSVVAAVSECDGQALDFAWRTVRGSCRSARGCAEIAVNNLIRSPQGIPVPSIEDIDAQNYIAIPVVE